MWIRILDPTRINGSGFQIPLEKYMDQDFGSHWEKGIRIVDPTAEKMDPDSGSHWIKMDPDSESHQKKWIRILNPTGKNESGFWIPLEKMDPDSGSHLKKMNPNSGSHWKKWIRIQSRIVKLFSSSFFAYFYAKIDKPFRDPEIFIISIFSTVQIWVFRVYINFRPLVVIFDGVSALISTNDG